LWQQEADQTAFHFIIKYPAPQLLRVLARGGVGTWINDFLDDLFNLGTAEDLSPLTYAHHEAISQDQTIMEVKVGFLARSILPTESLCSSYESTPLYLFPPSENNFALG